jgi:hypothetical protein
MEGRFIEPGSIPGASNLFATIANARVEVGPDEKPQDPAGDFIGASSSAETDRDGTAFDPQIHATDPSGKPVKTKRGRWARKRGRKPNGSRPTGQTDGFRSPLMDQLNIPGNEPVDDFRLVAEMATTSFMSIGTLLLGPDFQPDHDSERTAVRDAFEEYAREKGYDDIPPGIGLLIVCGGYVVTKSAKPTVQARLLSFAGFVTSTASRWGQKIGAWFNFRSNRVRKDNSSSSSRWGGIFGRNSDANSGPVGATVAAG